MINKMEKGQSLVLVTLLALAFFAILAVVLDGGFLYYLRRTAQNAADAGALAGADDLCKYNNEWQAETVAESFADDNLDTVVSTSAATATALWDSDGDFTGGIVDVQTTIDYQTFFARLIGVETVSPPAYAKADCAPVTDANGVMPVTFSCKPPHHEGEGDEEPGGGFLPGEDCHFELQDGPDCTFPDDPMYIAVDTEKIEDEIFCMDPPNNDGGLPIGSVDCDFDNDNVDDVYSLSGGNRSFLSMDGGPAGSSTLREWIEKGYPYWVSSHTWLPGKTGGKVDALAHFETHVDGDPVLVPVFDQWCAEDPRPTDCDGAVTYHDGNPQDELEEALNDQFDYFHIISFVAFQVECVDAKGSEDCPVHNFFGFGDSVKSVEGCFVEVVYHGAGGIPGSGKIQGLYTVYLSE